MGGDANYAGTHLSLKLLRYRLQSLMIGYHSMGVRQYRRYLRPRLWKLFLQLIRATVEHGGGWICWMVGYVHHHLPRLFPDLD